LVPATCDAQPAILGKVFVVDAGFDVLFDDGAFFWWCSGKHRLKRSITSRLNIVVPAFPKHEGGRPQGFLSRVLPAAIQMKQFRRL
jgi:hypothetical protein